MNSSVHCPLCHFLFAAKLFLGMHQEMKFWQEVLTTNRKRKQQEMSSSSSLATTKGEAKTTSIHLKPTMLSNSTNSKDDDERNDTDSTDDDTIASKEQQSKKKLRFESCISADSKGLKVQFMREISSLQPHLYPDRFERWRSIFLLLIRCFILINLRRDKSKSTLLNFWKMR